MMTSFPTKAALLAAASLLLVRHGSCAPPEPAKVSPPQDPARIGAKRYEIPAYSVQSPNIHLSKLTNWIKEGSTKVTNRGVELTDEETGAKGSMWNTIPMTSNTFDIEFEVEVRGPPEARSGDGFAVWFVSEHDYAAFLSPPSEELWSLFGYKPNFAGFVAMFATSDRANNPTCSISGLLNNHTRAIDIHKDVPSGEGVYFNFRNGLQPLRVRIQFTPETVKGLVRWPNEKDWKTSIISKLGAGKLPSKGYIGFSGSNRRIPKGESSLNHMPHQGDRIILSRIQVFTSDFDLANKQLSSAQEFYNLAQAQTSDVSSQVKVLAEMINKFVVSKQEHIMSELNRMHADNRKLAERMDIIQTLLTTSAGDQQLSEAFDKLKAIVSENSKASLQQIDQLKGGLNVDELSRRSVELEEVLKSHTTRTQWMTVAVGSILIVFGGLFYKRMRDMEKKHIL